MKVLLTGAFKYTEKQLTYIKRLGYEVVFIQDEREEIKMDVSDIEIVVCNGLFLYNDISKFKGLKTIQLTSSGIDRVPIDYIKNHNIKLYNAKGVYSIPMAEWVILKILEIYKKSLNFYNNQSMCMWEKQRELLELTDKTASIIGLGNVGQEVAKRLKAFDVNIIGVCREIKNQSNLEFIDEVYTIDEIKSVLMKSDIVILTLPLTDETKYLIDKEMFECLKANAVMINVSRGGIINEKDLVTTIKESKLLGVALDVFEQEPLDTISELWNLDKVIITPHNSFVSDKVNDRLFKVIINNLKNI